MSLINKIKSVLRKEQIDTEIEPVRRIININIRTSPWAISKSIDREEFIKMVNIYKNDAIAYSNIIKDSRSNSIKHYTQGQIDAWNIILDILYNMK